MSIRTKVWLGIGTFAFAAAADPHGMAGKDPVQSMFPSAFAAPGVGGEGGEGAAGGGEGGEGGGGEGGAAAATPPVDTDAGLVANLMLIDGELRAARELATVQPAAAATHVRGPLSATWARLEGPLAERLPSTTMRRLANDMEAVQTAADTGQVGRDLFNRLAVAEQSTNRAAGALAEEEGPRPALVAEVLRSVMNEAGDAYARSIAVGQIADPVQYRLARALTLVAQDYLSGHEGMLADADAGRLQTAQEALFRIRRTYPGATPPEPPVLTPGELLGLTSQLASTELVEIRGARRRGGVTVKSLAPARRRLAGAVAIGSVG